MAQLRYEAGRINNPNVHKVGIIALGSHLENHGPALPIDTDAKIGSYIALQSALESGAKFLGVVFPAHELDEIDHGIHVSLEELKKNLIETLKSAKKYLMSAAVNNGYLFLAVVMAINSAIAAYYYLKLIVYMFLREPIVQNSSIYLQNATLPLKIVVGIAVLYVCFSSV